MSAEIKAEMLDKMDGPLIEYWPSDEATLLRLFAQLAKQITKIARVTESFMPDVTDPLVRLNIALRLWAGCLDTAKTIALETRSGPNTAHSRMTNCLYIDEVASSDPIYAAGIEAAPHFKQRRGDPISFDGVPAGTRVFAVKT